MKSLYQLSEIELIYKSKKDIQGSPKIITSQDAYNVFIQSWDMNKIEFVEQAKVLLLNRARYVLGIYEVSSGGVSGTVVDPRVVFVAALKANASSIILAHNHPSGNLKTSNQDYMLTRQFMEAGKLLWVKVEDHLIVGSNGYYSFSDDYPF